MLNDFDCPTVQEIEVPKVLGDIFESLAGAVFVDSGMSIDTVWKVFYRLMKNELEMFSKKIPKAPLRELYETFPGDKVKFRWVNIIFFKLFTMNHKHSITIQFFHRNITNESNTKNKKSAIISKFQLVLLTIPLGLDDSDVVIGVGSTVKEAKQAAAKYVMRKIKNKATNRVGQSICNH